VRTEIARLHRKLGSTSIYVTHDQVEAMTLADRIVVMHEGEIQQVGSPMELYNTPHNLFVASFIGSPGMNQIDCVIEWEGDKAVATGKTLHLSLPQSMSKALQEHKEKSEWVIGFRPQHVSIEEMKKKASLTGVTLEVTEPLGSETFLYLRLDEEQMIIVRDQSTKAYKIGESYSLSIDTTHIHLFDKKSGLSLTNLTSSATDTIEE